MKNMYVWEACNSSWLMFGQLENSGKTLFSSPPTKHSKHSSLTMSELASSILIAINNHHYDN